MQLFCVLEFMNFMLFLIKSIEFKQRIKFKKFELQNYGRNLTDVYNVFHKKGDTIDTHGNIFIKS